jgi:uncharacterized protein (UPF0332 family)
VKPETADWLERARECLRDATRILPVVPRVAAREAYLAAFQAAQALIYERTGRVSKTHRGTRSQFSLLTRDEPQVSHDHVVFLAHGYEIKSWADYGSGSRDQVIPITPSEAIEAAGRFIEAVQNLLA